MFYVKNHNEQIILYSLNFLHLIRFSFLGREKEVEYYRMQGKEGTARSNIPQRTMKIGAKETPLNLEIGRH